MKKILSLFFATGQFLFEIALREAVEADEFLAGGVAAEDGDGASRKIQMFCEKIAEGVVRFSFHGWGVHFDFQRVTEPANDLRSRSIGNHLDRERAGILG